MSDCGVCLDYDADGMCEFYERTTVTARKPHHCCECGGTIESGQQYESVSGKYDFEFFACKTCLPCAEIRDAFTCSNSAVMHECLWEDMRDYVFPELTTGNQCLQKLSSSSRAFVIEKWQDWKGLRGAA